VPPTRHPLIALLAIGVVLRLLFVMVIDPRPRLEGGDVRWYLDKGYSLVAGTLDHPVQTGPVFLVYAGVVQHLFRDLFIALRPLQPFWAPHHAPPLPLTTTAAQMIRLLNVLWGAVLIAAVYQLGLLYFTPRVATLAGLVLALSPAFVIEAGAPLTESLFMALLFAGLALHARRQERPTMRSLILCGVLFGAAALTRVVVLLFPLALIAHLIRLHGWRRGLRLGAVLATAFMLTVSLWTVYNLARWNRFIIGGEGLTAFAYIGVTGITDPRSIDASIGEDAAAGQRDAAFAAGFFDAILNDFPGWVRTRLSNLSEAYLQPHNTVYYPGESLKTLALSWLTADRSLSGLLRVVRGDAFFPKLLLYLVHGWALIGGAVGMFLTLRRRGAFFLAFPLYGLIAYLTAVHVVIYALPRYLFPLTPAFYLFAAVAAGSLWRAKNPSTNRS